jgi:hypothetical protein
MSENFLSHHTHEPISLTKTLSWVDVLNDGQSAYQSWCRAPLWDPWPDFTFSILFFRKIAMLFFLGRPLWREEGSVFCSTICQWSESRRTHNHTLLSHLRLLGSLSIASYDSQGLRWKYSNPSPHGEVWDKGRLPLFIDSHYIIGLPNRNFDW